MKQWQLFSILMVAAVPVASSAGSAWSQTKEGRSGEEKMDARGAQAPGQMERKKGEEEMEARGAQKPGRMGKSGAESAGTKQSQAERWAAQDVKKVQEALKGKGHNPGSMDGVIGPQTRQAIRAFQNANGLKVTGRLDSETAEKLGIAKASASGASSSAAAKGQASPTEKRPMGR